MIMSRSFILRLREMFHTKLQRKSTHVLRSINIFCRKWCPLWDNLQKYGTARQATVDNTIRRMRIAYRITMTKNTHSEYVIFIVFPQQQRLRERASRLCLCVYCLSCVIRRGRPSIELIGQFPFSPFSSVTQSTVFSSTNCLCSVCSTSFIRI